MGFIRENAEKTKPSTDVHLDNPSERYVADYLGDHEDLPAISLDAVLKATGLIEQMGRERLKPRRETREGA